MQGEFDNDWKDLSILDSKLIDKEFDSNIEKRLQAIAEKEAEAARKRAEAELITKHPDFEVIRADEQFHEWVTTQPK